jgi:iron(III) transport system substrate-binding protein
MTSPLGVSYLAIGFLCFARAQAAEQVVVYCSVKEEVAQSVSGHFEKETGTSVKLLRINTQAASDNRRLVTEKSRSGVDVFWSFDLMAASVLKSEGLSVPYESPNSKEVPPMYSDPEHYWTGFPHQVRVFVYNKNLLVDPDEVPSSVFDMINPRFNARVCMASPLTGTTSLHAAALFQVLGKDMAEVFFSGLKTNKVTMVSSNVDVVNRVASGEFAFGVADSEDFNAAVKEGKPVGVVFPDQQSFGTLVLPSALVLMANAPHPEQAKQFIDFLLRSEIQKLLGPRLSRDSEAAAGEIKAMQVDYVRLVPQSKELSRGFLKEWVSKQK